MPSRMTIGHIVETITSKLGAIYGGVGDCTAFSNKGPQQEIYGKYLLDAGMEKYGQEILYNGMTGEQLETDIYIGPTYYLRLKHMPKDKINYRARGPRDQLTRQTVAGRANDGGLRLGEMDRDCVVAHGLSHFVSETLMKRGDEFQVAICNQTGCIAAYNPRKNIFLSPFADGPIKFEKNVGDEMNVVNVSKYGRDFSIVNIPYAFKLLMQELQGMNIQLRLITEDNIDQLLSLGNGGITEIKNLTHDKKATYKNIKEQTIREQTTRNQEYDRKEFLRTPSVLEEISVPSIISSTNEWQALNNQFGNMSYTTTNEGEFGEPQMMMGDPNSMMGMTGPNSMMGQQSSVMNTGFDDGDWGKPSPQGNVFEQEEKIPTAPRPKLHDKVIFNGDEEGHIYKIDDEDDKDAALYYIRKADGAESFVFEDDIISSERDPNYIPNEGSDSEDDYDEKPPLVIDKDDADIKKDITLLNVEEIKDDEKKGEESNDSKKSISIDKEL